MVTVLRTTEYYYMNITRSWGGSGSGGRVAPWENEGSLFKPRLPRGRCQSVLEQDWTTKFAGWTLAWFPVSVCEYLNVKYKVLWRKSTITMQSIYYYGLDGKNKRNLNVVLV